MISMSALSTRLEVNVWRDGAEWFQRYDLAKPQPLEAVGRRLGLTPERVRQVEAAGLRKLRALLRARGVDEADLP